MADVLDLYPRRIVGGAMQEGMTSQLVVDALMMAVWRRGKPRCCITLTKAANPPVDSSNSCCGNRASHQHEPGRRGLRQIGGAELLQFSEDRADHPQGVP